MRILGTEKQQICLSYSYGDGKESSCENTVNSVQRLFYNIPINTYFSLDLDGISALNDSVGGVDVVSPETIGEFVEEKAITLSDSRLKALSEPVIQARPIQTICVCKDRRFTFSLL